MDMFLSVSAREILLFYKAFARRFSLDKNAGEGFISPSLLGAIPRKMGKLEKMVFFQS